MTRTRVLLTIIIASDPKNNQNMQKTCTCNNISLRLDDITQNESKRQLVFSMAWYHTAEEVNGRSLKLQLLFTVDHLYHTQHKPIHHWCCQFVSFCFYNHFSFCLTAHPTNYNTSSNIFTHPWNDLLYAEWDAKLYTFTHTQIYSKKDQQQTKFCFYMYISYKQLKHSLTSK